MIKSVIRIALCYFLIFGQAIVHAQSTAAILPQGKTQFLDQNAKPLTSGTVDFYVPSTTTRKTTWQNSTKTTANANPVVLDAGGRAIIYGDGTYRQVVKDRNGNLIYDAVTASAGTGGSTTGTGDGDLVGTVKPWAGLTAPNQYAFAYGQEISRTTYSVLFTAITLAQNVSCTSGSPILTGLSDTSQIPVSGVIETTCAASGSTVLSKTSTTVTLNNNATLTTATSARFFLYGNGNGSTTFNVPDLRGYVVAGRCNMGGVACSVFTFTAFSGGNATGAKFGSEDRTLVTNNLPPYTPAGTVVAAGTISQITPAGTNSQITPAGTNSTSSVTGSSTISTFTTGGGGSSNSFFTPTATGTSASVSITTATAAAQTFSGTPVTPTFSGTPVTPTFTNASSTFTGTAQGGTSVPLGVIQPTQTLNYIIKITPDSNSTDASGVTSLGSMTGDIACGTGLLCASNIISWTGLNVGSSIISGGTSTGLLYNNAAVLGNTSSIKVNSSQQLLLGATATTASTDANLIISQNVTQLPLHDPAANANEYWPLVIGIADGVNGGFGIDLFGGFGTVDFRRANGTNASRSALLSGDNIGVIGWLGATGATTYSGGAAQIRGYAEGNWSTSSQPSALAFITTPSGSTAFVGIAERMRITNGGQIGIGTYTATAGALLTINGNTTALQAPTFSGTTAIAQFAAANAVSSIVNIDTYGTGSFSNVALRAARGTAASPSAIQSGDQMGLISAFAYGTSQYSLGIGQVKFIAAENQTNTATGARIEIYTTPIGGTSTAEAIRINASGGVSVGEAVDPGIGTLKLKAQTFASLTACSGTIEGAMASITDSATATWGNTITGSSTNHVLGYCNGTNWTVAGK